MNLSNNRLINEIGCSLTGLCKARKNLINRGFISYKKGNQFSAGTYTVHRQFTGSSTDSSYKDHCEEQKESELPFNRPFESCTTSGVNREEKHMESMIQNNISIYKKNNKQSMEQSNIYKTRQDKDKKRQDKDEEEKIKKEEERFHLLPHRRIIELFKER